MKENIKLNLVQKLTKYFNKTVFIGIQSAVIGILAIITISVSFSFTLQNYGFTQGKAGYVLSCFGAADGAAHDAITFLDEEYRTAAIEDFSAQNEYAEYYLKMIEETLPKEMEETYSNLRTNWQKYKDLAFELMNLSINADANTLIEI